MRLLIILAGLSIIGDLFSQGNLAVTNQGGVRLLNPNRVITAAVGNLSIPTYDSNPQCTHGNFVYFSNAWSGYKYWAVFTPYPSEARENPSIIVSNDGQTWSVPPGLTNPIDLLDTGNPYNSDPVIFFFQEKLHIFYRWTSGATQKIKHRSSVNGIVWSSATDLTTGVFETQSSFSVDIINNKIYFWYIDTQGGGSADYEVYLIKANTISELASAVPTLCEISVPPGFHNWQFQFSFDHILRHYVGIMTFTLKGAVPNNGGINTFVTSSDGIFWNVASSPLPFPTSPAQYLGSIRRTAQAEKNGAAYEMLQSVQWAINRTYIWLTSPTNGDYDGINSIEAVYSVVPRMGGYAGGPLLRVIRSSDFDEIDVFGDGSGGLKIANGTSLQDYKGESTLTVSRFYNQKADADYLSFTGTAQPSLIKNIWNGTTKWGLQFDGVNDVGDDFLPKYSCRGVTMANYFTLGRPFSIKSGSAYFGLNGNNITLLNGTNISSFHLPSPCVYTAIWGTNGYINRNGVQLVIGNTTNPDATKANGLGAHYATSAYTLFSNIIMSELVVWNEQPSGGSLSIVENKQMTDFAFTATDVIYDSFTDTEGTLITAHVAETRPMTNLWSANDALWKISSNKLTRISAGSGVPVCTIDSGISDGIVECTLNPASTGGSGLVFRYLDDNNFIYVRLFNGTTLGLFKYVAGSFTTIASASVSNPGKPFILSVQLIGSTIRVLLNGTAYITQTVTDHVSNTRIGCLEATNEPTTTWEDLRVTKWN